MPQITQDQIVAEFTSIASRVINKPVAVNLMATFADMEIDSIQAMEIVGALEDKFDIEIPDDRLVTLNNISGLIQLVMDESQKVK